MEASIRLIETKILDDRIFGWQLGYKSQDAAGIDLFACNVRQSHDAEPWELTASPFVIYPGQQVLVGTGVAFNMKNPFMVGITYPRSGLGNKGLVLANTNGVIDADYQGEIICSLLNRKPAVPGDPSANAIEIRGGDRIAQIVFLPIIRAKLIAVDAFSTVTERGTGGHGSTGK